MIDNKWPNFRRAFNEFRIAGVAKLSEKEVGSW